MTVHAKYSAHLSSTWYACLSFSAVDSYKLYWKQQFIINIISFTQLIKELYLRLLPEHLDLKKDTLPIELELKIDVHF